jgi:superfamily I DNA/RNA helicase
VKVAAALRANGYEVTDTFSEQNDRVKKTRFYKGASAIKVTTIHSIKGLSVTQYVLVLGDGAGMNPSLVLTGLSRLKAREYSTAMTVVCQDQTLASLGERFPHCEGISKPAST